MFITEPNHVMQQESFLFNMQTNIIDFYMENLHAQPTEQNYQDATEFINNNTQLKLTSQQTKNILALHPRTRIKLAVYEGISDTEVRDLISFSVAHFFLNCSWPLYKDNVNIEDFVELLKKQAMAMGYEIA